MTIPTALRTSVIAILLCPATHGFCETPPDPSQLKEKHIVKLGESKKIRKDGSLHVPPLQIDSTVGKATISPGTIKGPPASDVPSKMRPAVKSSNTSPSPAHSGGKVTEQRQRAHVDVFENFNEHARKPRPRGTISVRP
jgi:hypothetical protein